MYLQDDTVSGPIPQNDVVGPPSYGVDSSSPPFVGVRQQQPTVNTANSETVPGDQSSACLSSPILHMPDVRASSLSIITSSSPSNISASASTCPPCDDEPLSTPPALDVPEEASRSFFPSAQMPVLDSSTHPSANGGFTAPSLALDSCTNDIPFANQLAPTDVVGEEVQKKKKRKRKSDNVEGEGGGSGTTKRNRKKKPKASDADTSDQVLPTDSSEVPEGVPAVDDSGVDIPVILLQPKSKKSNKDPSAPKTPKVPKVPKEKKMPKEPKPPKEPKSNKSKRSSKAVKPPEKTEEGDFVPPALEVVEIAAEGDDVPPVEQKPKPTPRPKPKKKRYLD